MTNKPYFSFAEEFFMSMAFTEWILDGECFDSEGNWNAYSTRPFSYQTITDFLAHHGTDNIKALGLLLVPEAISRMSEIRHYTGLCSGDVAQVYGMLCLGVSKTIPTIMAHLVSKGLSNDDAEIFLRSASLHLNVIWGKWPFKYYVLGQPTEDKAS
ncbi:MAG: hypothetical protein EOL92_00845 [Bacteroidia bacterium]|nr:hypothetical protein [Bacteroidia bacterium]